MPFHTLFPTIIYDEILDIDNDTILNCCYENRKENTKGLKGPYFSSKGVSNNSWRSESNIHKKTEFKLLVDAIQKRINLYHFNMGFKHQQLIQAMWININGQYSYNTVHTHGATSLAGSYYVKMPEDVANINFFTPLVAYAHTNPKSFVAKPSDKNAAIHSVSPKEKQLLLFPSWLQHTVDMNQLDEDRISIAFVASIVENARLVL